MLDTHARKYVQPLIEKVARLFIKFNRTANQTTMMALVIGLMGPILFFFNVPAVICVFILWFSGLIDAVDGTIARLTKTTSSLGSLMDITFDRIVEIAIILVLALKFPEARLCLLFLSVSIILSMTVFLTVGIFSEFKSNKSFYYQAGVAERSEGFILFSLMLLFTGYLNELSILFSVVVLFTAIQRFWQACRILQ